MRIPATIVCKGQRWSRLGRTARVMAVLEGWVVYRFPFATPHCSWHRDFESNFTLDSEQKGKKK